MRMALGGLHPCPVGTVEEVADVFQAWVEEADVDGFNIGSVTNPGSWEDVVDLLIPELQRRGLYWVDYDVPGGTFRENLLGTKELRDDHYGSSFKWAREKSVAAATTTKRPAMEGKEEESLTSLNRSKRARVEANAASTSIEVR
jgi:hypothetical protein